MPRIDEADIVREDLIRTLRADLRRLDERLQRAERFVYLVAAGGLFGGAAAREIVALIWGVA